MDGEPQPRAGEKNETRKSEPARELLAKIESNFCPLLYHEAYLFTISIVMMVFVRRIDTKERGVKTEA